MANECAWADICQSGMIFTKVAWNFIADPQKRQRIKGNVCYNATSPTDHMSIGHFCWVFSLSDVMCHEAYI